MKMKPISRAGRNGSAVAAARQTQKHKRSGERSRKLTRAEFALLDEINSAVGAASLEQIVDCAEWRSFEAKAWKRAAALLRREPTAWEKYYAQGVMPFGNARWVRQR
jgi:hypothetical protein